MLRFRARGRDAISEQGWPTADVKVVSLYSLYMLWMPLRLVYRKKIPYVLSSLGFSSKICLTVRISPVVFFILRNLCKKYQKRDLAATSLPEKIFILYISGSGSFSVGVLRPTTMYNR